MCNVLQNMNFIRKSYYTHLEEQRSQSDLPPTSAVVVMFGSRELFLGRILMMQQVVRWRSNLLKSEIGTCCEKLLWVLSMRKTRLTSAPTSRHHFELLGIY